MGDRRTVRIKSLARREVSLSASSVIALVSINLLILDTKVRSKKSLASKGVGKSLPIFKESCSFEGYDADILMSETEKLRELITKRGTLEILIPLCCTTDPVR